jgi:hypothetical protein
MSDGEPIHVTIVGDPHDPRAPLRTPAGVVIHYAPDLHPDDVCVVGGILTTSPSRTLIDLAEVVEPDELRELFMRARDLGLLDREQLLAARRRVEWRASLQLFDEVMNEFCPG